MRKYHESATYLASTDTEKYGSKSTVNCFCVTTKLVSKFFSCFFNKNALLCFNRFAYFCLLPSCKYPAHQEIRGEKAKKSSWCTSAATQHSNPKCVMNRLISSTRCLPGGSSSGKRPRTRCFRRWTANCKCPAGAMPGRSPSSIASTCWPPACAHRSAWKSSGPPGRASIDLRTGTGSKGRIACIWCWLHCMRRCQALFGVYRNRTSQFRIFLVERNTRRTGRWTLHTHAGNGGGIAEAPENNSWC